MNRVRSSLITKIALLVICVEIIALGVLGGFYIDRFSTAIDRQIHSRLRLVGELIAQDELQIDAIARTSLMSDLLGVKYLQGMVIGGNDRVIVSTDASYLGRSIQRIAAFNPQWVANTAPELQFISSADTLTCIMRVGDSPAPSFYHIVITIDTTAINAEKRHIAIWGWSASLAFIILSSVGITLLAYRFISRRVDSTLEVMKQAESGAMDIRIAVSSHDEMGQLQLGINSMIENIGSLLSRHRRNEEELSAILNAISEGLIAIDMQARILRFNANAQELLETTGPITQGRKLTDFLPELADETIPPWEYALIDGITVDSFHFAHTSEDARTRSMDLGCGPIRDSDDNITGAVLVLRDITERQAAEEQLRLAANVFTHAREGIVITDADGTIVNINKAFTQITGYGRHEAIGQNPRLLKSDRHDQEFYTAMWHSLIEQGYWIGEIWNRRRNGEIYPEMLTISAVKDTHGETQHYVGLFFDITVQKQQQQQLEYIAHYDALTHLPNRVLLADRLHQSMAQAHRRSSLIAVVYLDLDGFKEVNDQYGHDTGDQLLLTVAQRMKEAVREGDTVARLGGDEFVAVLVDLADPHTSQPLLRRLLAAVSQPVAVDGAMLQISASLGITFYPQTEEVDADQLLRQADQAMYQAKLAGKNTYHVFDTEQDRSVRGHHESIENIRRALNEQEFILHYQPQVNMRTGEFIGVEALIRWQHPERGLLYPDMFLTVIEDHPLSVELGEWVLNTALAQLNTWHEQGLEISVSVNVSALQLQQPNFTRHLNELLAAYPAIKPGDLKLEVLESSALNDIDHVSQVISACDRIGVSFALDDFGTGYSSLTYLKRLPATQLKIDRTFVHDMLEDPDDLAILEGVLSLASAFRREAIAEGVESRAQGETLLQLGCELAQGFGIARPMPAEQIQEWAGSWQTHESWANQQPASGDAWPLLLAGVELRAWFRGIEENLEEKRPPLNHHQCRFGRWLDGQKQAYLGSPVFEEIESLHRQVHELATALLQDNNRSAATTKLPELHDLKDRLLRQLKLLGQEERRERA